MDVQLTKRESYRPRLPDKEHPIYTFSDDIKQICQPLIRHFHINHFSYVKTFHDAGSVHLSMNPDWCEFFYEQCHHYQSQCGLVMDKKVEGSGFIRWDRMPDQFVYQDLALYFNSFNGLVIAQSGHAYTEYYFLGLSRHYIKQLDVLMSNLDLLDVFVDTFKFTAASIIKKAEQSKLVLPKSKYKIDINEYLVQQKFKSSFKTDLLQQYGVTPKECESIHYLLMGMTTKEIARQMEISPKTVEKYMENLKFKMKCSNKSQLIIKLSKYQ